MTSNREERLQMRQRGAGTRKIKDFDFGFSFGSPLATPQPSREIPPSAPDTSTLEQEQLASQPEPNRTPTGSQHNEGTTRTPRNSRNGRSEQPPTSDIPLNETPEQERSSKRRKISPSERIPGEPSPPLLERVQDEAPAPTDDAITNGNGIQSGVEAVTTMAEGPIEDGALPRDISEQYDISHIEQTAKSDDTPNGLENGSPSERHDKDKRGKQKLIILHLPSRRKLVENNQEQGNGKGADRESTEPAIPDISENPPVENAGDNLQSIPKRGTGKNGRLERNAPTEFDQGNGERTEETKQILGQRKAATTSEVNSQKEFEPPVIETEPVAEADAEAGTELPEAGLEDNAGQERPRRRRKQRGRQERVENADEREAPRSSLEPVVQEEPTTVAESEPHQGEADAPEEIQQEREPFQQRPLTRRKQRGKRQQAQNRDDGKDKPEIGPDPAMQASTAAAEAESDLRETAQQESDSAQERPSKRRKQKQKDKRAQDRNHRIVTRGRPSLESVQPEPEAASTEEQTQAAPVERGPQAHRGRPSGAESGIGNTRQRNRQSARKRREEGEAGGQKNRRGETVPITVHRLANVASLGEPVDDSGVSSDEEDPHETRKKFPNRGGVNPADVLSQICRETLDKTLNTLANGIANESNPARRAEWTRKRKAVEAYGAELEGRLFEMSEMLDSNFVLGVQLREAKKGMTEMRNRLLAVRQQRQEVALRIDAVRRKHSEEESAKMSRNTINNSLHSLELTLDRNRVRNADDPDEGDNVTSHSLASIAGLEFQLRTVADNVSSTAPGSQGGLLNQVKAFNAQLEMAAKEMES